MSDPTLALPFDQYQRYRLVADILTDLRGPGERLSVLDVGGRTALLRLFLPDDQVFLVDVEASEEPGLVLGDGCRLPYRDDAVDAVVAFDTLEHVPPAGRAAFLAECRRVARRWVVIAGPYATEGVARAEELLTAFLRDKMDVEHRYLAEHASNGLPDLAATEEALGAGQGARVLSVGHANLERWLALMCLELYLDRDAPLRAIAARIYEFYNAALYASDHAGPVYRHAVVAAYDGAALPSVARMLDPPVAPAGAFGALQNIVQELLAYDVERDMIQPEWERLERVNGDLLLDLEGHKDTLMILQEVNVEQKQVIEELRSSAIEIVGNEDALLGEVEPLKETIDTERGERDEVLGTLEQDLAGHRSVVVAKTAELERLTEEQRRLEVALAHERGEHEQVVGTLKKDLDGHRAVVGEKDKQLRRLEAALAYERSEYEEVRQTLEQDLAGHREVVAAQGQELDRLRGELAAYQRQQAELERALEEQRGRATELEAAVAHLRGELGAHQATIEELAAEVARRDGTIAELVTLREGLEARAHDLNITLGEKQAALDIVRAELSGQRQVIDALQAAQRDRWANLLRALGVK